MAARDADLNKVSFSIPEWALLLKMNCLSVWQKAKGPSALTAVGIGKCIFAVEEVQWHGV